MSEKASYVPEPHPSAPPPIYEQSTSTAPPAEQNTQQARGPTVPEPDIQLQSLSPQQYGITTQHEEITREQPGPSNLNPQTLPPQQYTPAPQPSQYSTAVPLHALQRTSQVVDCPVCHEREMTRVEGKTGKTTHGWAAVLLFAPPLCCVPYFVGFFKDMNHLCGKCGHLLATYHSSGHVVVHEQIPQGPK